MHQQSHIKDKSPKDILDEVRATEGVRLTSTGMRDAGQSDYKNRHRIFDLAKQAPHYNEMGLFSAECHGGAKWHVGIMSRKESPFEEINILRKAMPNVMLQTLVRETNLWGYRPYPKNIIEYVVSRMDIDIWRTFSFLNDIRNMRTVAEVIMKRAKLFEPAISFTQADWADNNYYLSVVDQIIELTAGSEEIILCIKDMAGVGSPKRIGDLVDAIKQRYPDLVVQYHRHSTDGLGIPALLAAAQNGAKILDVQEDSLTRFYGQPAMLPTIAYLEENGIPVLANKKMAERAVQNVREWIRYYQWAESPFKGLDYGVTEHRMPGGAFPSSFEQASKGGFLHFMPHILKVMSLFNKIVNYFDVTPGSQITWVTCSGLVNNYAKEKGEKGVQHLIGLLTKFVHKHKQDFSSLSEKDQKELLLLFRQAPGDFKNLLLGNYGKLPNGWPADWVYQSAFGDNWQQKIQERKEESPLDSLAEEDLDQLKKNLEESIGRSPTDEEFVLYLMHPKDVVSYIEFREKYGRTPLVLPSDVWREGLQKPGDKVEIELDGKPYTIEFISKGDEHDGLIYMVMRINNSIRVFSVETPRVKKKEIRMAKGEDQIGSPINGNVWRIGNPERGRINIGDIVHEGEEVLNLEAMKMETAVRSPYHARVSEIAVQLHDNVIEGQLLVTLKKIKENDNQEE